MHHISKKIYWLIIAFGIINPFALLYLGSNVFFILCAEILLLFLLLPYIEDKIWISYLFAFQFFGVGIGGIKIYDLTFIFIVSYLFIRGKFSIKQQIFSHPTSVFLIVFLLICIVKTINSINSAESIIELSRYALSISIFLLFAHYKISFYRLKPFLISLSLSLSITGLLIFNLTSIFGFIGSIDSFIKIQYHYEVYENRITGFFSDPNKFYQYFFFIIVLYEIFKERNKDKIKYDNLLIFICVISAIISLSRLAIISMCMYFGYKLLHRIFFKNVKQFYILAGCVLMIILYFSSIFIEIFNQLLIPVAEITGRTRTLEIEPSITEGTRYEVWKISLALFEQSPLLGYGLVSHTTILPIPTHNTPLALFLDMGILGFTLFVICFRCFFKHFSREYVLCLLILPALTLDMQTFRLWYILLAINTFNLFSNEDMHSRSG